MRSILVTDFDGTITDREFYQIARERLTPAAAVDYWALYGEGRVSHFEAMRGTFGEIRAPLDEVEAAVRDLAPDPALGEAVRALRAAGWEVVAASAGSSWYIQRVLDASGIRMTVYANPGHFEPERGLVLELPRESPYFSPSHGIDKTAIVRDALAHYENIAYAGDGPPDLDAALLVEPRFRFARGMLARALNERGLPYREYHRWSDIARLLVPGVDLRGR